MNASSIGEVIESAINIFVMVGILFFMINKKRNDPNFQVYGIDVDLIIIFTYFGLGIFLLLAIFKFIE